MSDMMEIVRKSMIDYKDYPNEWKKVLSAIYSDRRTYSDASLKNENNDLIKELKIKQKSLEKALCFLKEQGLIEVNSGFLTITKKGFDVARENENKRVDLKLQFGVIYFTTILALTQIFQFFNELKIFPVWILLISFLICGAVLAYIFTKSIIKNN